MKKFCIYFFIFFLVLLLLFYIGECISLNLQKKHYSNYVQKAIEKTGSPPNTVITYNDNTFDYYYGKEKFHFREPSIVEEQSLSKEYFKYPSIIIAGCSYVHGANLMYKDTFGKVLSDYTQKNVYNFAIDGGSPRDFLYILRNKNMVNDIVNLKNEKNIEYVIYVFIPDQLPRLLSNVYKISPSFKLNKKNNTLTYYMPKIFFSGGKFLLFRNLHVFFVYKFVSKEKLSSLFSIYMREAYKEIKKIFGDNTKFVVLLYDIQNNNWDNITRLESEKIIVVNVNDIVDVDLSKVEYMTWDELHPNRKAWEIIVPALSEYLNLKN